MKRDYVPFSTSLTFLQQLRLHHALSRQTSLILDKNIVSYTPNNKKKQTYFQDRFPMLYYSQTPQLHYQWSNEF